MQNHADIAVVVPAYNEELRIASCLDALLYQSLLPKEVIIVNNNSEDKTPEIIEGYKKRYKKKGIFLRLIKEPVQGIGAARRCGFSSSRCAIIASTDADCRPRADWLERIKAHFDRFDSVAVTGPVVMSDSNYWIRKISEAGWYILLFKFWEKIYGFQIMNTANSAYRRLLYEAAGGFNANCVSTFDLDDTELASRLSRLGKIRIDRSILVDASFRRYQDESGRFSLKVASATMMQRLRTIMEIGKLHKMRGIRAS